MCMHTFVSVLQVFGHVFVRLVHIVCVRKRERERDWRQGGKMEEITCILCMYVCVCACV